MVPLQSISAVRCFSLVKRNNFSRNSGYRLHSPPDTVIPRMKGRLSQIFSNTCSGVISVTLGDALFGHT